MYAHELYHRAQELLVRFNHRIESILAEGPVQEEVPLFVHMELYLSSLVH